MHIAFDRGHEDTTLCARIRVGEALGLHERSEPSDGLFHHTGAFDDLRQEHFPCSEKISNDLHALHERTFDNQKGLAVISVSLLGIDINKVHNTLDKRILEPLIHRFLPP